MARPLSDPVPMVGYVRVSKAREEMISPDLQRSAIKRWAAEHNRVIVAWLTDLDLSGREFAKRRIGEGVELISAGAAAEIGVYRYDRWGRNTADSLANIARVEQAGGQVVSVTEPFDVSTAVGQYTRENALALATMQSNIIGENWRSAHAHRVNNGLPAHGHQRFGYTYTPRKHDGDGLYHPDPVTGPLLAALYPRWLAGETFGVLGRELNHAGYRTPRFGAPWHDRALRATLDSGFAAGLLIVGGGWRQGRHTPLIPARLWEAYKARRAEVSARPPAARKVTHRLSGLLTCGHCGKAAAYCGTAGIACTRYRTTRFCIHLGRKREDVENEVRDWLQFLIMELDDEIEQGVTDKARAARAIADESLLKAEKVECERLLLRAFDAFTRDIVDESTYLAQRNLLQARLDELTAALDALSVTPDVPRQVVVKAVDVWDEAPPAMMNALLKALIGTVIVRRDRVIVVPRWEMNPEDASRLSDVLQGLDL